MKRHHQSMSARQPLCASRVVRCGGAAWCTVSTVSCTRSTPSLSQQAKQPSTKEPSTKQASYAILNARSSITPSPRSYYQLLTGTLLPSVVVKKTPLGEYLDPLKSLCNTLTWRRVSETPHVPWTKKKQIVSEAQRLLSFSFALLCFLFAHPPVPLLLRPHTHFPLHTHTISITRDSLPTSNPRSATPGLAVAPCLRSCDRGVAPLSVSLAFLVMGDALPFSCCKPV